ncbi:MAG: DNA-binding protein, partial [Chromatiales bacterium]|nr:DNA-binding protein [Chromatiales bacterium]
STNTGLTKKDVQSVLDELGVVIERHIKKRAVGTFTLPGLMKIKTVRKPASKAKKMFSHFTKTEITVKAKPASTVVKVQPLRGLKVMVE